MFTYIYLHLVSFYGKFVSKYTGLVPWESGSHGFDSRPGEAVELQAKRKGVVRGFPWDPLDVTYISYLAVLANRLKKLLGDSIFSTEKKVQTVFQGPGRLSEIWMFPKIGVVFAPPPQIIHLFL